MFVLRLFGKFMPFYPTLEGVLPIPFYSQSGILDLADIKPIQCVVNHVEDRGIWGFVDRSGPLARAE